MNYCGTKYPSKIRATGDGGVKGEVTWCSSGCGATVLSNDVNELRNTNISDYIKRISFPPSRIHHDLANFRSSVAYVSWWSCYSIRRHPLGEAARTRNSLKNSSGRSIHRNNEADSQASATPTIRLRLLLYCSGYNAVRGIEAKVLHDNRDRGRVPIRP